MHNIHSTIAVAMADFHESNLGPRLQIDLPAAQPQREVVDSRRPAAALAKLACSWNVIFRDEGKDTATGVLVSMAMLALQLHYCPRPKTSGSNCEHVRNSQQLCEAF